MARLIDADALLKTFESLCVGECCCCEEAAENTTLVGNTICRIFDHCGLIDSAPTIDAIPVEWLEEQAKDNYDYSGTLIRGLLSEWQKKQEAQDG